MAISPQLVDLHTHSTASDGSASPAELVRMASSMSLAALAVTDHDTLDGLPEAEREAALQPPPPSDRQPLEVVRGCEISTVGPVGEVHILGLWVAQDARSVAPLEALLDEIRGARHSRNLLMAEKLAKLGLPVRYQDVSDLAGGEVVGRPHFAALLLKIGAVADRREAFEKYLKRGALAYVPRQLVSPEQGVRALAGAAHVVAIAHPCLASMPPAALEEMITRLTPLGLNAIEAYHSEHNARQERYCVELAAKYRLLLTGGSDYHGRAKPSIKLGTGKGSLRVSAALLHMLKKGAGIG